jgi:hypothetical protein
MDGSVIVLSLMWAWIFWDIVLSPTALCRPKRDVMAHIRRQNERRGITMRPGWWYHMPDGTSHMSPTGREKDKVVRGTAGGPRNR